MLLFLDLVWERDGLDTVLEVEERDCLEIVAGLTSESLEGEGEREMPESFYLPRDECKLEEGLCVSTDESRPLSSLYIFMNC